MSTVTGRSPACERRLRQRRQEARLRLRLAADAALVAGHHASAVPSSVAHVSVADFAALRLEVEALRALVVAAPAPPGCASPAGGDPSGDLPAVEAAPAGTHRANPSWLAPPAVSSGSSGAPARCASPAGGDPSGDLPAVEAAPAGKHRANPSWAALPAVSSGSSGAPAPDVPADPGRDVALPDDLAGGGV